MIAELHCYGHESRTNSSIYQIAESHSQAEAKSCDKKYLISARTSESGFNIYRKRFYKYQYCGLWSCNILLLVRIVCNGLRTSSRSLTIIVYGCTYTGKSVVYVKAFMTVEQASSVKLCANTKRQLIRYTFTMMRWSRG